MAKKTIDKGSPEYLFAQVLTRLEGGDKSFKEVKEQLVLLHTKQGEIGDSIKALPCNHRVELLNQLKEWQDDHDTRIDEERERAKERSMSLRQAVILIIVTAMATSLCGFLLQLFGVAGTIVAGGS